MNFKTCPNCGFVWETRNDFLSDASVFIIGYQAHFKDLSSGLFLFNHSCKGTLALKVSAFQDLYHGIVYKKRATGTDACPGYCLHEDILEPCSAECECASIREIVQILRKKNK